MLTTKLIRPAAKWFSWWQALPTEKPKLSAALAGLILGIAFPPASLPWGIWMAFPLLWGLAQRERPYRLLYLALLIWNFIGCYWLMLTALSAPNLQEAILSLAAGAAAILANPLLMLLPFFIWRQLRKAVEKVKKVPHSTSSSVLLFIPLWGLFEALHFRWELTWSWLNLGFAWSEWSYWRNMVGIFGVVGLSVWSLMGAALLHMRLLTAFVLWGFGSPALSFLLHFPTETAPPRHVYAIQPDIDPYAKFAEFPPSEQVQRLLSLLPHSPPQGALIVLPETAIPTSVSIDAWEREPFLIPFKEYVQRHKVNLLIGIVGYKYFPPGSALSPSAYPSPEGGGYETYNAALLLRPDTVQLHIKSRLVPFVERVPYLEVFTFLRKWQIDLGGGFGNFGKPSRQEALSLYPDELPLTVAICYESIFMHDLRKRLPNRPALIAIITNDGWWKKSSGYWQHLTYGQLTADALGTPAVRSANTGVSALLSSSGARITDLGYHRIGRIEGILSPQKPATLYYRWGEIGWIGVSTFALIVWWIRWYRSLRFSPLSEK
ncbi:MAG: apolipoprotein N-acyltransferase [Bacteroidia bacterium]|nr:apolipoprotein N-acyltransferase [Bacteroidia bacterium]MDW8057621.1 apolipoprotein N-acyltransferase [Bacteroidia bacterium]